MSTTDPILPARTHKRGAGRILSGPFVFARRSFLALGAEAAERDAPTAELSDVMAAVARFGAYNAPLSARRLARAENETCEGLHDAARAGDASGLRDMLGRPVMALTETQREVRNRYLNSALRGAAGAGHTACVELLLPQSNAGTPGRSGLTALMLAAMRGGVEMLELLLPHSDAKAKNCWGHSAIQFACDSGHAECADLLAAHSERSEAEAASKKFGPARMPRWLAKIESEELGRTVSESPEPAAAIDEEPTPKARSGTKRL